MTQPSHWRDQVLNAQGLPCGDRFGNGEHGVQAAIEHLGYLQIDTISVVARAHHHTLWNRVPDYEAHLLDTTVTDRKVFEYWAHAAAYLPMRDYRFALVRMREQRDGKSTNARSKDTRLMRKVLKRVDAEGPLRSRDFESKAQARSGWWDWKPTKRALEQLFMQGDLMISGRAGFQKCYDLRERVLPDGVDTRFPNTAEYAEHLIDTQLRSHGVVTEPSITYLRRGRTLRKAVTEILTDRVRAQNLLRRDHEGVTWYCAPPPKIRRKSNPSAHISILSPFDNLLIQRQRLQGLFGFNYQLECYVPEGKRKYGYFTLPVLRGNSFIARMDCKAHRKTRVFEVKSLHWEAGIDATDAISDIATALVRFAHFNGCRKIQIETPSGAPAGAKTPAARRLRADLIDCLANHEITALSNV
jgi:uncharacterized protein YcaQ